MRGIFIVTGPILGYMLDHHGMGNTLIALAVIFAPLMLVVLGPLLVRIRRETGEESMEVAATS